MAANGIYISHSDYLDINTCAYFAIAQSFGRLDCNRGFIDQMQLAPVQFKKVFKKVLFFLFLRLGRHCDPESVQCFCWLYLICIYEAYLQFLLPFAQYLCEKQRKRAKKGKMPEDLKTTENASTHS